eukprot:3341056-Ditylum_brightwellii.AAC.1
MELDHLGEKALAIEWMNTFVKNIVDPDFKTLCQLLGNYLPEIHQGNVTLKFKEFTNMVKSRQMG